MKRKTAMMELIEYILINCRQKDGSIKFSQSENFNKFLEKEKYQIMDAYDIGFDDGSKMTGASVSKYYNETYKQD